MYQLGVGNQEADHSPQIRILIVEPDKGSQDLISHLFSNERDMKVIGVCGTQEEALRYFSRMQPDIVVQNIHLPDNKGLETTKSIIKKDDKAIIVLISMGGDTAYLEAAYNAGAVSFVLIPESQDVLLDTIRLAVNKPQMCRAELLNTILIRQNPQAERVDVPTSFPHEISVVSPGKTHSEDGKPTSPDIKKHRQKAIDKKEETSSHRSYPFYLYPTETSSGKTSSPEQQSQPKPPEMTISLPSKIKVDGYDNQKVTNVIKATPTPIDILIGGGLYLPINRTNNLALQINENGPLYLWTQLGEIEKEPEPKTIYYRLKKAFAKYNTSVQCQFFPYPLTGQSCVIIAVRTLNHSKGLLLVNSQKAIIAVIEKEKMIPTYFIEFAKGSLTWAESLQWKLYEGSIHHNINQQAITSLESYLLSPQMASAVGNQGGRVPLGYVYLLKMGQYYKIGKANVIDSRIYQLKLVMPEEPILIHAIETDDPYGIEKYWHRRFDKYHKNGEFFELPDEEVEKFIARKVQ